MQWLSCNCKPVPEERFAFDTNGHALEIVWANPVSVSLTTLPSRALGLRIDHRDYQPCNQTWGIRIQYSYSSVFKYSFWIFSLCIPYS